MGSSGCEGRLERPPSVQEIVIMQWIVKKIINKFIVNKILTSKQHLDQGDGEVVRGGVEPLDRGHHAAVVHCAQELRLETKNMMRLPQTISKSCLVPIFLIFFARLNVMVFSFFKTGIDFDVTSAVEELCRPALIAKLRYRRPDLFRDGERPNFYQFLVDEISFIFISMISR